jgi:hypothetical protein
MMEFSTVVRTGAGPLRGTRPMPVGVVVRVLSEEQVDGGDTWLHDETISSVAPRLSPEPANTGDGERQAKLDVSLRQLEDRIS